MSVAKVFVCAFLAYLVLSGFWVVIRGVILIPEVFVPVRVCHKAIHLYGVEQDDQMTTAIMDSLVSLDQPFEFHTHRIMKQMRFNSYTLAFRMNCLAYIVLVHDTPMVRQMKKNLILKRFNRVRGNENDFVLLFAQSKDGISKWTDWRAGALKYVLPNNFPENALLIELDEGAESENGLSRLYVSDIYIFQLYCSEEQEVCWKHWSVALFPKHKNDFDASFSRERAQWHYDYNRWPILLDIDLVKTFDDMAKITFRQATWGRFTWDDYNWQQKNNDMHVYHVPTIWLIFEIANHMNATLEPKPRGLTLEQRTEIRPSVPMLAHKILELRPYSRNIYINFKYFTFGYCTNGTGGRENTNLFAFFTPLDVLSWVVLAFMMVAIAMVGWYAGHGFQLFQLIACLGSQSFSVNSNDRLAGLFVLWHLIAFVVFNCYSAFLESVLTVPYTVPRIQDFKRLNESCEVPWIFYARPADLKERVQGIPHLKALMDRPQLREGYLMGLDFFREIVEHEEQCAIFQAPSDSHDFADLGAKFQPDATCSEGTEKLIGDPVIWHINPPNVAVIYRTVRALQATGIVMKFGESHSNRFKQLVDYFVTESLQVDHEKHNITEHTNDEHLDSEGIDGFTMANIEVVFHSFVILSSFALFVFLAESLKLFVNVSCYCN